MTQDITSIQDVIAFIDLIAEETGDGNPFQEISRQDKYTAPEAAIRSKLMEECFQVCTMQPQNFKYLILVLFNEAVSGPTDVLLSG